MALFRFNWLRRLVRKNTNPIAEDRASKWKQRLSVTYAIVAWNAFGLVCYMIYSGKSDWADYYGLKTEEQKNMSPGHQWAKTLGIPEAQVYRVHGLSLEKIEKEDTVVQNK